MIDKNTFCSTIKEIIKVNEALDELQNANPGMALSVVEEYSLQDALISVLEQSMNLYVDNKFGSTISWWIYDTKFGKDEPYLWLGKKRSEKNKITLDTVEKLYDWCVKEGEQNV